MELPKRKQLRLKEYDYSQNGAYFVTICAHERRQIFAKIGRGDPCGRPLVTHTTLGEIACEQIKIAENRYNVKFSKYVIMPNHIHAIINIDDFKEYENIQAHGQPQGLSLQYIVGGYKSCVSNKYLKYCKKKGIIMGEIWQKSYHDHIIRNEQDYLKIWDYIDTNALKWEQDIYHTE